MYLSDIINGLFQALQLHFERDFYFNSSKEFTKKEKGADNETRNGGSGALSGGPMYGSSATAVLPSLLTSILWVGAKCESLFEEARRSKAPEVSTLGRSDASTPGFLGRPSAEGYQDALWVSTRARGTRCGLLDSR